MTRSKTYTPELREEAAKLVLAQSLTLEDAALRLTILKRPTTPPVQRVQRRLASGSGNNESIWLLGYVGRRSKMLASQRAGSRPLSFAVANMLWIAAAARRSARSETVKSQFFCRWQSGGWRSRPGFVDRQRARGGIAFQRRPAFARAVDVLGRAVAGGTLRRQQPGMQYGQ